MAFLPINSPNFRRIKVIAIVGPSTLRVRPTLRGVFINISRRHVHLFLDRKKRHLPNNIGVLLLFFHTRRQFLDGWHTRWVGKEAPLTNVSFYLPMANLLILFWVNEYSFHRRILHTDGVFLHRFGLCHRRYFLTTLDVIRFLQ